MLNSRGPISDPCGMPSCIVLCVGVVWSTSTLNLWSDRYELMRCINHVGSCCVFVCERDHHSTLYRRLLLSLQRLNRLCVQPSSAVRVFRSEAKFLRPWDVGCTYMFTEKLIFAHVVNSAFILCEVLVPSIESLNYYWYVIGIKQYV